MANSFYTAPLFLLATISHQLLYPISKNTQQPASSSQPISQLPRQQNMMQPVLDTDRDIRLGKAVALVTNRKYSVRKAAQALQLPKSTVHRYLQATRGHLGVSKRPRSRTTTRPAKCDISFLVQPDQEWWTPSPSPPPQNLFDMVPSRPRSCLPDIPFRHVPVTEDHTVKLPSIST